MLFKIIHSCNTMTVRQYSVFESKRDLKLLFRYASFLPVRFFEKQIEQFTTEFNALFSEEKTTALYEEIDRVVYANKIVILQTLAQAINMHLVNKSEIDVLKLQAGIKQDQTDLALAGYLEQIKEFAGIEINTLNDIIAFKDELERMIFKYNEMYPQQETKPKGIKIMTLFFTCCQVLKTNPDYTKMTLVELAELNRQAIEVNRQQEAMLEKYKG